MQDSIHPENEPFLDGLSDLQVAYLRNYPCPQLFAVVSWGCAATGWIARILNSHPKIYCVHAANHFWHMLGNSERLDGLRYLRVIGSQGYSHLAAGDVHGVTRHHIPELKRCFAGTFNAAVVVREPLARLHSQLALFEKFEAYKAWDLTHLDDVILRSGVTLAKDNYRQRFFVHAANMLNAILEEQEAGPVYRSEDLTQSVEILGRFVEEITGGKVSPGSVWLGAAIRSRRVNAHAGSRPSPPFTDWQVDVIRRVVDPRSWELYEALGYPPVELTNSPFTIQAQALAAPDH